MTCAPKAAERMKQMSLLMGDANIALQEAMGT